MGKIILDNVTFGIDGKLIKTTVADSIAPENQDKGNVISPSVIAELLSSDDRQDNYISKFCKAVTGKNFMEWLNGKNNS